MDKKFLHHRLLEGLKEDSAFNDITTSLMPDYKRQIVHGRIIAKESGLFCGEFLIKPLFKLLDKKAAFKIFKKDGQRVNPGETLAIITANAAALLGGERLFLNLACSLSGIATLTDRYVRAVKGTGTVILDTRKTTPLWRDLEKYAVACGGGVNHRMSLGDAVLIKDNHLQHLRCHQIAPSRVFHPVEIKKHGLRPSFVEFEAKTIREVWEGIKTKADIIMLDNMSDALIKKSLILIRAARRALGTKTPLVEVSGGVTIDMAKRMSKLGVERISVGALTHSAAALDITLLVD